MTIFVLEDLDPQDRRTVFSILGTEFALDPLAWVNPILMSILGIIIAFLFSPTDNFFAQIVVGIVFGLLVTLTGFLHGVGHIISSKIVNAPMQILLQTSTIATAVFDDEGDVITNKQHFGRAIGGPVLSLLVGLLVLIFAGTSNQFLTMFMLANFAYVAISLSPIPTVDGPIIYRALNNWND